ncbi:hypothetical protein [Paenibacillus sp. UNC451MF]|uniref:hypothetical protein n=1 Tax=Paenibacillus sp. UNC451MF TaxID=1449063 RepID=UPI00048ADF81|nr:hypothetical protein [Paenibacillus sp. UNC451MF]
MLTITNRKVKDLKPSWAPFNGFSFLFDNPGDSLRLFELCENTEVMNNRYEDQASTFYRILYDEAKENSFLIEQCGFCPLPLPSYHVTVWDGVNDYNVHRIDGSEKENGLKFLEGLPHTLLNSPFVTKKDGKPLSIHTQMIEFTFAKVHKWGNSSLVALLQPANKESAERIAELEQARVRLNDEFIERFGIQPATLPYRPHVSLGYFANNELADQAESEVQLINKRVSEQMEGLVLCFQSISLYGMINMETFFRRKL